MKWRIAMTEQPRKTIGIVLVEGFADWEFGLLAGGAAEHFGAKVVFLSPDGKPVTSIGGLEARPARGISPKENEDLDAVALIGSDTWTGGAAPDLAPLVTQVRAKGGVVGGICAATVALAKGGFLDGLSHTSNGADWIKGHAAAYPGAALYKDVPRAVSDRNVVTAPGTAPISFAAEFLASVFPGMRQMADGVKTMFGAEHS
jgi:putative intracellular protease/amidase